MTSSIVRKQTRRIKRYFRQHRLMIAGLSLLIFIGLLTYTSYMQDRRLSVDPKSYEPLLQLIARVESKGNYNAYFGNSQNTTIDFTTMPLKDVMAWQADYVAQGNPSSAVGKYQIVSTTLSGLTQQLGIDSKQPFDATLQDQLAVTLLERRGSEEYVNGELTKEQFAANLAKEWAALPKVIGDNPSDSYYASDGLNKSLVNVDEVLSAIEPITGR